MFITALWALEQEAKAWRYLRGHPTTSGKDWSKLNSAEQLFMGSVGTGWLMGHIAIGSMPYTKIFGYAAAEDLFLRELALHSPRSAGGKGVPAGFSFGLRGFKPKWLTASVGRKAAAKIASRWVPVLGWALFALDMWAVGKWVGKHTDPFD